MAKEPQYREWVNTDGKTVLIRTDVIRREKGRVDSAFVSPVDGSLIRNQADLREHNIRNNVQQEEPGMQQDWDAAEKKREDFFVNGNPAGKEERIEAIKHAIDVNSK